MKTAIAILVGVCLLAIWITPAPAVDLDTQVKRMSVVGCPILVPTVKPDVTKPLAWREAAAWGYAWGASSQGQLHFIRWDRHRGVVY